MLFTLKWNQHRTAENGDARIDITFTTSELKEENLSQRQELGAAADAARIHTRCNTGVNYYAVRPKVRADQIKSKVVWN